MHGTERDAHAAAPIRLASRPWPGVGRPTLFIPVGSTEQHGPHLPLDTDSTIADAVAHDVARRCRERGIDAAVAPGIHYGASGEHEGFAGTVSIGTDVLTTVLLEIGRSSSRWAERLVFVNGHGGNADALSTGVPLLRREGRKASWLACEPAGDGADAHAGFTETSVMAHLAPTEVGDYRRVTGNPRPLAEILPELRARGVRAVSPTGVLGDPERASAQAGIAVLRSMCDLAWQRVLGDHVTTTGRLIDPLS